VLFSLPLLSPPIFVWIFTLSQRREVRDIVAYLKVLQNPESNDLALERICNVPPRLIGDKTVLRVQNLATLLRCSMWEVLERIQEYAGGETLGTDGVDNEVEMTASSLISKIPTRGRNQLLNFKNKMDEMRSDIPLFQSSPGSAALSNDDENIVSNAILALLKTTGYDNWIRYENAGGEDRWGNLRELVNFASGTTSLQAWLDEVALLSDPQDLSNGLEKISPSNIKTNKPVKIMTIHASKGSEFDVVFIAGVEEELLPHHFALVADDVAEERRLCYVAITRAKRRAVFSFAKNRVLWGQRRDSRPSQFLMDLVHPEVQWLDLAE
jgi:DNA helicase II / ATP-dependent DNA helicase PcrA|tara:strand:- start:157 stop:1131 length:975 start_codon:yes stop_codon:yes gene_type:complete